ncbi:MAG: hypothetical protein AAFQ84_12085, partial [Pseudomonadota bacterium]
MRAWAELREEGQGAPPVLEIPNGSANPELRISEGRTYANPPPAVPSFACDLFGAKPQPMADPFDAERIEMGDGIASPKPSQTNLRG